jgi:hypothetical protein
MAETEEVWSASTSLSLPISLSAADAALPDAIVVQFNALFEQVIADGKGEVLDEFLLELVGSVISDKITVPQVVKLLTSVEFAQSSAASIALTDVLWFWGSQLDSESAHKREEWGRLCALVKEVYGGMKIDSSLLMTSLSLKLLAGAGIIKDEKFFQGKMKRLLTTLVYKQQKFNLLREETEGYSKLAVILCSLPQPQVHSQVATNGTGSASASGIGGVEHEVSRYINQVLALIGHFDLDANR